MLLEESGQHDQVLTNGHHVLLVEDNELDAEAVGRSFRRDHMVDVSGRIRLTVAPSLSDAREILRDTSFDAILLDLGLPEGVGLPILETVIGLQLQIPIIILTGNEDDELGLQALRVGADDYLKKSSISAETLPRAVRYSIERNHRMVAEAELHETRAEIIAAETIQRRLLPDFSPPSSQFDIAGKCVPAAKIGGDLFDYLSCSENSCTGVIADVSGHGLPAAILMTELHGLLHGLVDQQMSLPRLMCAANRRTEKATESYQFITMLAYTVTSEPTPKLTYISAGHPLWLIKPSGETLTLKTQHLPLGVHPVDVEMQESVAELSAGDIVVLPTDGVFEALGPNEERYGIERMLEFIHTCRGRSSAEIVSAVFEDVFAFAIDEPSDDCTLVIVQA